eukprot:TRINITY_DN850_c0_g1_i2.p1 TRINITY_DN850_c0_g1~~TRINITY_DN850_c0_g1_i2.p1  ORF type:complete len:303 (+),score=121.29 TRINITY_DN850_c0_g1_i2:72-911(+)
MSAGAVRLLEAAGAVDGGGGKGAATCLVYVRCGEQVLPAEVGLDATVADVLAQVPDGLRCTGLMLGGTALDPAAMLCDVGVGMQSVLEGIGRPHVRWDREWGGELMHHTEVEEEGGRSTLHFKWGAEDDRDPELDDATLYARLLPGVCAGESLQVDLLCSGRWGWSGGGCRIAMIDEGRVSTSPRSALGNEDGASGLLLNGGLYNGLDAKAEEKKLKFTAGATLTVLLSMDGETGRFEIFEKGKPQNRFAATFTPPGDGVYHIAVCGYDVKFTQCALLH